MLIWHPRSQGISTAPLVCCSDSVVEMLRLRGRQMSITFFVLHNFLFKLMINTIAKLGIFNVWANETLLRRMDSSVAAGREIPHGALRIFSHVINAQAIWIARLSGTQSPLKVWQEHDLASLHHWHEQTSQRFADLCQTTDEAELTRHIQYSNSQGDAFDSQVSDVLTHCVVHASYHRGQVATKMREGGLEPVNTDFITYCREVSGQVQPQL